MTSGKVRVNEIDLLRFCAALFVVIYHYAFRGYAADGLTDLPYPVLAPIAKYGYLGVDLFFMISGFVILMTAANGSLKSFAISRVVRLYPAYWVCCTLTAATILALGAPRYSVTIAQYLINMTMLSGFVGVPDIDGSYWSLFVEMRFYALVAVVLLFKRIQHAQTLLICWLAASVTVEVLHISKFRTLLLVDYAAFFVGGAICFLIWSDGVSRTRIVALVASGVMGISESVKAVPAFERHYGTQMNNYVIAAIIGSFFVTMYLISVRRTGAVGRRNWVFVGTLTYPLYLLHQNIGFIIFNRMYGSINPHLILLSTLGLMLGASLAVHVAVERKVCSKLKAAMPHFVDSLLQIAHRPTEIAGVRGEA